MRTRDSFTQGGVHPFVGVHPYVGVPTGLTFHQ